MCIDIYQSPKFVVSEDNKFIYAITGNNDFLVFDIKKNIEIKIMHFNEGATLSLGLVQKKNHIYIATQVYVHIFDMITNEIIKTLEPETINPFHSVDNIRGPFENICVSHDEDFVIHRKRIMLEY